MSAKMLFNLRREKNNICKVVCRSIRVNYCTNKICTKYLSGNL